MTNNDNAISLAGGALTASYQLATGEVALALIIGVSVSVVSKVLTEFIQITSLLIKKRLKKKGIFEDETDD